MVRIRTYSCCIKKSTQHINAILLLKAYLSCKKKVIKQLIENLILINLESISDASAPPISKRKSI